MKFGLIKSKIDKILLESFSNKNEFKSELKNFQNTILENKKLNDSAIRNSSCQENF